MLTTVGQSAPRGVCCVAGETHAGLSMGCSAAHGLGAAVCS